MPQAGLWCEGHRDQLEMEWLAVLHGGLEYLDRAGLFPGYGVADRDRVVAAASRAAGRSGERPGDLVAAGVQDADADRGLEDIGGAGDGDRAGHLLAYGRVLHGDRGQVATIHRGGLRAPHRDSADRSDGVAEIGR